MTKLLRVLALPLLAALVVAPACSDDDSDGSTSTTTSSSTTGTTGPVMCEVDMTASECDQCVQTNCCEASEACINDTDCNCFQECMVANGGGTSPLGMCSSMCGVSISGGITGAIVTCTSQQCISVCG